MSDGPSMPGELGTAPDQVDRLKFFWEDLPPTRRDELVYCWVDHSIRKALVSAYRRIGRVDEAGLLEVLPPIVDEGTMLRAELVLKQLVKPGDAEVPTQIDTCTITALMFVTGFVRRLEIWQAAFMMVMTSRFVFGDDRLVKVMEDDLVTRAAG